ncbi:probable malonyl-CoA-acyl carrier protein transacylase, mitochondrial [Anthonomus grandis grandis]|uniref:probable malonyl-CoA-acyl carrier protein transacylase, mitochondrial n=1 Tax=Anthonomus grandis grandis TaxID=2921223 RepID=UPI0021664124|nr:probable malonyl-CoA-acyl carrier protein transacylase, mitochondrial [Anthonomus grandis grandis]
MPCLFQSVLRHKRTVQSSLCRRQFFISNTCQNKDEDTKPQESPLKRLLNDSASFDDAKPKNPEQQWATTPYPQGTKTKVQDEYLPNKKDPRDSSILLFPGQGSQYVGMAKDLLKFPMAKDLFDLSSYILKYDLLKLCLEGPKAKLDETRYSQPAIMVSSLAAIERLKEERPNAISVCVGTAGFSIGEITALVFAGAIEFEKGLKLVQIRAEAMQLASEKYKGGMLTIFYGPDSKVGYACKQAKEWAVDKGDPIPECKISNYLYPHCKVVAGSESAIDFLEKNYKEYAIRRVKRLPVSGAFHSHLMQMAVEPFRKALNKIDIRDPLVPVYSNVNGKKYSNAEHIRRLLPKQIVKPVKWEQIIHTVYERKQDDYFPNTFECGPGQSLKTILKQVNAKAWDHCHSIEA